MPTSKPPSSSHRKKKTAPPRAVKAQRDSAATVAAQVRLGLQKGDLVEVRDSPAGPFRRGVVTQIRDDGRPLVRRYELDARSGQGFPFREVCRRPPPPAAASSEVRASIYDTSQNAFARSSILSYSSFIIIISSGAGLPCSALSPEWRAQPAIASRSSGVSGTC